MGRCVGWAVAVALAGPAMASAQDAPPAKVVQPDAGFAMSIREGTQGNFGKLGIGAGSMGAGSYLDDKGVLRSGLHAALSIAVEGEPSLFRQIDVSEGQTVEVAGYRIIIDKIVPQDEKGTVILRIERTGP